LVAILYTQALKWSSPSVCGIATSARANASCTVSRAAAASRSMR
jgi:hypothetical protein